jgi:hypothetical protein
MTFKIEDPIKGRKDVSAVIEDRAVTIGLKARILEINNAVNGAESVQQYKDLTDYTRESMKIIIEAQKAENDFVDRLAELAGKMEKGAGVENLSKAAEVFDVAATELENAGCIVLSERTKEIKKGLEVILVNDRMLNLGRSTFIQSLKNEMTDVEKQIEGKENLRQKCFTVMVKLDSLIRG